MSKTKKFLSVAILIYYILYILFGNVLRMIQIKGLRNDILISEALLYVITALFYVYSYIKRERDWYCIPKQLLYIIAVFVVFTTIGFIYHRGQYIQAVVYCVRYIMLLLASLMVGKVLLTLFEENISKVLDIIIGVFVIYSIVAWALMICMPNSTELWKRLADIGIKFSGDPHFNRIFGTFFDPNFFGSILILPLFLCIYNYFKSSGRAGLKYLSAMAFLEVTLVHTYSRSGTFGFALTGCLIAGIGIFDIIKGRRKFDKRVIYVLVVTVLCISTMYTVKKENVQRLTNRFQNVTEDPSAQHRIKDFQAGSDYLFSSPYVFAIGVGYNYVKPDLHLDLAGLDSSISNTLISFGVIGTALLIAAVLSYVIKFNKNKAQDLNKYVNAYLLTSVAISNFNNLLYYQFYVMVTFVVTSYLISLSNEQKEIA